jgi:hypothetical protein
VSTAFTDEYDPPSSPEQSFGRAGTAIKNNSATTGQQQNAHSPDKCVRIASGGVGERLKPAVLKFARQCPHPIQINNLRYRIPHRNGVFWAALAAFCATKCATVLKMCNSVMDGDDPIITDAGWHLKALDDHFAGDAYSDSGRKILRERFPQQLGLVRGHWRRGPKVCK